MDKIVWVSYEISVSDPSGGLVCTCGGHLVAGRYTVDVLHYLSGSRCDNKFGSIVAIFAGQS